MKLVMTFSCLLLALSFSAYSSSCSFSSPDKKVQKFLKKQGLQVASSSEADFVIDFKDKRIQHQECEQSIVGKACVFINETIVNIDINHSQNDVSFLSDSFSRKRQAEFGVDDKTFYPEGRMKEMLIEKHLDELRYANCNKGQISNVGREIAIDKDFHSNLVSKKSKASKQ